METHVDPAVSRQKFERELAEYRKLEDDHLKRGWWLLKAEFPEVFVVFATPKLNPPCVMFGAVLDFTDYDFQPPSVKLVQPFTRAPYKFSELPNRLIRTVLTPNPPGVGPEGSVSASQQALMVAHRPDDIPFFCIPGVREYHSHPGHSGDLWELRRGTAEGTLYFLLSQIHKYGVEPIAGYSLNLSVAINGFKQNQPPE